MPKEAKNEDKKNFVKIRSFLANNVDTLLENLSVRREASKIDSEDLFGDALAGSDSIKWKTDQENKTILEVLLAEKESLGLYVSGNPLQKYKPILEWARKTADREDLFLVLIDKVKKIFTRNNAMMFALQITTPFDEEKLEGIIFPKTAMRLSPKLEEKKLFWAKGQIIQNKKSKKKKEQEDVNEGDVQEYVELPKLAIDSLNKFSEGVAELFEYEEIKLPVNRIKALEQVDWEKLLEEPATLEEELKKKPSEKESKKVEKEEETKEIKIGKEVGPAKLTEIKKILSKKKDSGLTKIVLKIEKNGDWKTVKGDFWVDLQKLNQILGA